MNPENPMWGHDLVVGRHRRPEPPAVVHLVFGAQATGGAVVLPAESRLARSMCGVASLLYVDARPSSDRGE